MTKPWIEQLHQEIGRMIADHVEQFRDYYIVAIEQEQDHEKGISDRGGNHERPCDDSRT